MQRKAVSLRKLYEAEIDKNAQLISTNDHEIRDELTTARGDELETATETINDFNEFVAPSRLKGLEHFVDETDHVKHYDTGAQMPFNKKIFEPLKFPRHLSIYILDKNNFSSFPQPKKDALKLFSYYLMDISSILPPLLLNAKPIDIVLDLCSAPGGKAMNIIQSMSYKSIVCNDFSRSDRLKHVFGTYFTDLHKLNVNITAHNAEEWVEPNAYTKVLVDVPCTNDRESTVREENNMFSHAKLRERILLPERQINMLCSGLKAVQVGGAVVYSTCSLSPVQNDGVVHMALSKIANETSMEFVINDLSAWIEPWKCLFSFHDNMRHGQLILPYLPLNCGPTYFCRLERRK
uniref:NOL1/NOP2/Sun domain family member 4 n=1 Tax=Strigamia maritima TaxID=126957 RepID=T1IVH6_STRMM